MWQLLHSWSLNVACFFAGSLVKLKRRKRESSSIFVCFFSGWPGILGMVHGSNQPLISRDSSPTPLDSCPFLSLSSQRSKTYSQNKIFCKHQRKTSNNNSLVSVYVEVLRSFIKIQNQKAMKKEKINIIANYGKTKS